MSNEIKQPAENKMGVMPENKLLISMALPMIISMLVQALYNVIDSIFVARITTDEVILDAAGNAISAGSDAISALGLSFPIQMLLIAIAGGTGVGVNAIVSKSLGEKNQKLADKIASLGVFLMMCSYVVFLLIGLFLTPAIMKAQGATGRVAEYGVSYLSIVCVCSIGMFMQMMFERLLQSTGRTIYSMITQLTGALINIILDPIMIFGLFGMPKLGVAGAAYATVIGQIVAAILAIIFNAKKNPDIHVSFKNMIPDKALIGRIYAIGVPSIIMQAIGSVMTFSFNKILNGINTEAVPVFTVYYKLQSIFFMPVIGLSNAMIPIVAYNFGAAKKSRMLKTRKLSYIYAFMFMVVGFLLFQVIPDKLLLLFDTGTESLITLGVPALRIIGCHYLIAWFCIISSSMFQALGTAVYSMLISIARQLVVLIPAAYILGKLGGLDLIWWSFVVAEFMSLLMCVIFLKRTNKKILVNIEN